MKYKPFRKVLAVFVAISMLLLVFNPAVLAEGKDTQHGYGWRPATTAEKAAFEKHAIKANLVLPNKLAIQRINAVRQEKGLEPLPESLGVPVGQEMVKDKAKANKVQSMVLKAMDQVYGAGPLPANVDNSTFDAFPEIGDQGNGGSCAAFAVTYYMATYERARVLGLNAKSTQRNQLSPKYAYNLVNGGDKDAGSSIMGNMNLLNMAGALTMEEFKYDNNFTAWPTSAQLWRAAYSREAVSEEGVIVASVPEDYFDDLDIPDDAEIPAGMTALKTALMDGKVLVFGTYIDHWNVTTISDNPDISEPNEDHNGESIATSMQPIADDEIPKDGHAMTVVGYDDNIWVDMNTNGTKDPEEMGAVKVANSWGKEATWAEGNDGFIWVSYEALKDYECWPDKADPENHPSIFSEYGAAYWLTYSNQTYSPLFTAEIDLTTNNRYQLTAYEGINWCETDEPKSDGYYDEDDFYGYNYESSWILSEDPKGAAVSLDGTTENHRGTVVLDLTKRYSYGEFKDMGGALTFCVGIFDSAKAGSHTIHSITFKDEKAGKTFSPLGAGLPYTANNNMKWFSNKYIFNPSTGTEAYVSTVAELPQMTLGVPISNTYREGDGKSWRFTPTETGKYKIAQNKPQIEIGVENECRMPLLLTNDPLLTGNITATLYAGRTYVIDASYEEQGDWDEGDYGGVFPVTASVTITKVSTAPVSSASADVSNIRTTSAYALSPAFSPAVYSYDLKASGASTTITATLADGQAYATIDGKVGTSATINLSPDKSKLVRVDVFAKDWSKSKTYKILVSRPKSTDATLATPGISAGTWWLSPSFDKNKTRYTLTLGENQGSIKLTPVATDSTSTIKIDGKTMPGNSKTVSLLNGKHIHLTIRVTPQAGKYKTYYFTIQRKPSTNNDLANLTATYGTWDSGFKASDTEYWLNLGENQKSTKITASKVPYSTVSPSSKTVSLEQGKSTIVKFTVKAQSGLKKTYTVHVVRAPSTDATLKSLKGVTLAPKFNKGIYTYTATLPAKKSSVTLSAAANNKYAKVAYYTGGVPCSKKIVLAKPGDSITVEIRVTAQDTRIPPRSYFITITRNLV